MSKKRLYLNFSDTSPYVYVNLENGVGLAYNVFDTYLPSLLEGYQRYCEIVYPTDDSFVNFYQKFKEVL